MATQFWLKTLRFSLPEASIKLDGSFLRKENLNTLALEIDAVTKADLVHESDPTKVIPAANFTFNPLPTLGSPINLIAFQMAPVDAILSVFPAGLPDGVYTGVQRFWDTDNNIWADFTIKVTIASVAVPPEPPAGPEFSSDSVYQEILATGTFPFSDPAERFILSAFVCPGTGSARVGFADVDADNHVSNHYYIEVASTGQVIRSGGIDGGIQKAFINAQPYPWYRLYLAIDYKFDLTTASNTFLLLENTSPLTGSHSVWFDGIQMEKAIFPDQTKPTAFNTGKKIVSPNPKSDMQGDQNYYEW